MRTIEFDIGIAPSHPALPGHFPGNPVVPGVLLLDRLLAGLQAETGMRARRLDQARFHSALRAGEEARAYCSIDGPRVDFRLQARRRGVATLLASGRLTLGAAP